MCCVTMMHWKPLWHQTQRQGYEMYKWIVSKHFYRHLKIIFQQTCYLHWSILVFKTALPEFKPNLILMGIITRLKQLNCNTPVRKKVSFVPKTLILNSLQPALDTLPKGMGFHRQICRSAAEKKSRYLGAKPPPSPLSSCWDWWSLGLNTAVHTVYQQPCQNRGPTLATWQLCSPKPQSHHHRLICTHWLPFTISHITSTEVLYKTPCSVGK